MPPRKATGRGGPQKERVTTSLSGGRGGLASRGSRPGGISSIAEHITTIGVRRPGFGRAGRPIQLEVNSFELSIEDNDISHYDVIDPGTLSARRKLALFDILQTQQPNVFTPKIAYDGQKMAYATRVLDLGEQNARKFPMSFPRPGSNSTRPPRVYNITLTKVATINTEVLRNFVAGQQSWDERVSYALMAYNVAIRMKPNMTNPFRGRSFFIEQDRRPIGAGLEVWRGIFQSVRPAIGRFLVNVDLASTVMYREGPLIRLCNEFLGKSSDESPLYLAPNHHQYPGPYELSRLKKFLAHVRIVVPTTGQDRPRSISGISTRGASAIQFKTREDATVSVAQYFNQVNGRPLKFPNIICVEVGQGAMIPLEMCTVLRGQFISKDVVIPQTQVANVLEFATKKPSERLAAIKTGMATLQYQNSDYISQFGMSIDLQPVKLDARVIDPPNLKYSGAGRQAVLTPRNGAWNMLDKKFIAPSTIKAWMVIIYQDQRHFSDNALKGMIKGFQDACASVGIVIEKPQPLVKHLNGQGVVENQLREAGNECFKQYGIPPNLLAVVLPENAGDIYRAVKHFGDVTMGVATQCLRASKCGPGKQQYWMNVMLKVNGKLGGINSTADSSAMTEMADPRMSTVVIGADVIHPPPGALDRPSFTAVVGSVDSRAAKYVGTTRVQTGRQEIIDDLKDMCKEILLLRQSYQSTKEKKTEEGAKPKRLIFYRDGVSEGEFKKVKDLELSLIKEACEELGMNPKITLVIVGKRHHNQMFPSHTGVPADSKNAPAGTVIDTVITHPTDFDFFLCSHAGILGTSRPAHYSILHDENTFNADALQRFSYDLCHCYAPATRAVSIPAPVYYADRICSRAKNHFHPNERLGGSDAGTQVSGQGQLDLEAYKAAFRQPHQAQRYLMYFL